MSSPFVYSLDHISQHCMKDIHTPSTSMLKLPTVFMLQSFPNILWSTNSILNLLTQIPCLGWWVGSSHGPNSVPTLKQFMDSHRLSQQAALALAVQCDTDLCFLLDNQVSTASRCVSHWHAEAHNSRQTRYSREWHCIPCIETVHYANKSWMWCGHMSEQGHYRPPENEPNHWTISHLWWKTWFDVFSKFQIQTYGMYWRCGRKVPVPLEQKNRHHRQNHPQHLQASKLVRENSCKIWYNDTYSYFS